MSALGPARSLPTLCGVLALSFWAMSAALACQLEGIPPFQVLAMLTGIGFMITSVRITIRRQWKGMKQPALVWGVGMVCICLTNLGCIFGLRYAPPEQVDLINYLWPIFVVGFAGFLPSEKMTKTSLFSVLLGFSGIYVLFIGKEGAFEFNPENLLGYSLGMLSALSWAGYTLFSRTRRAVPSEIVGLFGVGTFLVSTPLHFLTEQTVMPSGEELLLILFMGMFVQGTAYALWDYGVRQGHFSLLSVVSYGTPIVSIALLVWLGRASDSPMLFWACILVVAGSLLELFRAPMRVSVNLARSLFGSFSES